MSDETRRALDEAIAVVDAARVKADASKQECLDIVADGIPSEVEQLAKRIAQSQPDVTKGLGVAGVKSLRAALAAEAADLAKLVRGSLRSLEWPSQESEWSKVAPGKVRSALFKLMFGAPVDRVGNIFGEHGYDVQRSSRGGSQGLVLPQYLFSEDSFAPVADALNDLGSAEFALQRAKAEDDRDTVDSLWDGA